MIVRSVIKDKNKFVIHVEDSYILELDSEVYYKTIIREDSEISEEQIIELINLNDEKRLKEYSLKLLSFREYSEKALREKLLKRIDNSTAIEKVVKYLKESKYLNDFDFAKHYLDNKLFIEKKGLFKIKLELKRLGISNEIMEELCSNIDEDKQLEIAVKLAEKKLKSFKDVDTIKIKGKLYRFLMSRGYDNEICSIVIDKLT